MIDINCKATIGINGFGRIGKLTLWNMLLKDDDRKGNKKEDPHDQQSDRSLGIKIIMLKYRISYDANACKSRHDGQDKPGVLKLIEDVLHK